MVRSSFQGIHLPREEGLQPSALEPPSQACRLFPSKTQLMRPLAFTFRKCLTPVLCAHPWPGARDTVPHPSPGEGGHSAGRIHTKRESRVHARFCSADPHSQETLFWQQNHLRKHLLKE